MTSIFAALIAGVITWTLARYAGVEYALGYIGFTVAAGKIAQAGDHKVLAQGIVTLHRTVLKKK